MAIQLSSVAKYLESKNIPFKALEKHLLVPFQVETSAGKTDVLMCFSTPVDGEVFCVESADFLPKEVITKLLDKQGFVLSLLNLAWRTPFGGCELSSKGDELRFVVELPLKDATLTEAQFQAAVEGVQLGTKLVCELALEALGKAGSSGSQDDLMAKLQTAAGIIESSDTSDEQKKQALDFIVAVARDENSPTTARAAASKYLDALNEALEEAKRKASGGNKSPFA